MRNFLNCVVTLLFMTLLTTFFAGCGGGNSGGVTSPAPPQTGDTSLFPNTELMVSPAEVATEQAFILDARSAAEYGAGHIPGAISAPPDIFEQAGEQEVLKPVAELETLLGSMGIARDSAIIIYDNTSVSGSAAGRLFWILEYLGCTNVKILNGGWYQWNEYYPDLVTTLATNTPVPAVFIAQIDATVQIATKEDVVEHFLPATDEGYILIDVRTAEEYQAGHIPGAINFPYNETFNADKTILNFQDLKLLLAEHGVAVDKTMVVYSTLGHRSGFFYYLCRLMDYSNVINYIGSIEDWTKANSTNPVAYPIITGSSSY